MVALSKVYKPVYVVVRGRGVHAPIKLKSWNECLPYVTGFPGAEYKKCPNDDAANRFIAYQLALQGIESPTTSKFELVRSPTECEIDMQSRTIVYTDGSSIPNVGAGYGIVMIDSNGERLECYGKVPPFSSTECVDSKIPTNNQAELYAIAVALENCSGNLLIRTDSEYSIHCLTKWYKTWKRNGWKNSKGEKVANHEFIKYIIEKLQKRDVVFEHVRGHCGDADNERCDELAKMGSRSERSV